LENLKEALHSQSVDITGEARRTDSSFPFVSLPNFEVEGESVLERSLLEKLSFCPIVKRSQLAAWNQFARQNQGWIDESWDVEQLSTKSVLPVPPSNTSTRTQFPAPVFGRDFRSGKATPVAGEGPFLPWWYQTPPPEDLSNVNMDILSHPAIASLFGTVKDSKTLVSSNFLNTTLLENSDEYHLNFHRNHTAFSAEEVDRETTWDRRRRLGNAPSPANSGETALVFHEIDSFILPHSLILYPVFNKLYDDEEIAGVLFVIMDWDSTVVNLLPEALSNIVLVLRNSCGGVVSYMLYGPKVRQFVLSQSAILPMYLTYIFPACLQADFLGKGDKHSDKFSQWEYVIPFHDGSVESRNDSQCFFTFHVYPTDDFELTYHSTTPEVVTVVLVASFFFVLSTFAVYDRCVARFSNKVLFEVSRSQAIVSTMFPSNVQDRLFPEGPATLNNRGKLGNKSRLKNFLVAGEENDFFNSKPIADLFPETTVLFADVAGFTAWSSTREPSQVCTKVKARLYLAHLPDKLFAKVFSFLETVFAAFDAIARQRRVFKVETVGDCYVAVSGLPDPRRDHAVVMARFARDCVCKFREVTKRLELILGPDVGELALRVGIHSGAVTAGVLRGERSRFQLFGDTMNTASRVESTGAPNRIHLSQETASMLIVSGKEHWVVPRDDLVVAKGKGVMRTFWLNDGNSYNSTSSLGDHTDTENSNAPNDETRSPIADGLDYGLGGKEFRLVRWTSEVMLGLLRQIECQRPESEKQLPPLDVRGAEATERDATTVLEEVREIIELPPYASPSATDPDDVILGRKVESQVLQ
jgi:class 3 adenylate cyclase